MTFNPDWNKLVPNIRGKMVKPNCWTKEVTRTGKTICAMRHVTNVTGYKLACRNEIVEMNFHASLRVGS